LPAREDRSIPDTVKGNAMGKTPDALGGLKRLRGKGTKPVVKHAGDGLPRPDKDSDRLVFFSPGELVEVGTALQMFINPRQVMTQNDITGRFG
jgi:ABC-type phosphate transport system ATPase subunit